MKGIDMDLSFGTERIYDKANFHIEDKDKVGLIGVNGAGKTTLFKVILKEQPLDSGKIMLSKNKQIGYLPQEIKMDHDISVLDYLLEARPIKKLEERLTTLYEKVATCPLKEQKKYLKEIGSVQEQLEYYDCYQAENILFEMIEQMKIDLDLLDQKVMDLSGGQKSKIAFAHLLYSKKEILLLDEPTNHLDVQTRDYIIQYLKNYQGMVLIISHDVDFLDAVTSKTLFLDKTTHQFVLYTGNYTEFQKKYQKQKELKERLLEKQEKENERLREIVLLYSNSSGKRKRMAQSREKQLNKNLEHKIEKDQVYKSVKLKIKPRREESKIPMKINNISFHYEDKSNIIENLSFVINRKERFLICGENGVGKSTLLKLLVGVLKPDSGNIWLGSKTDLAYYAQEQELLDPSKTILENVDREDYSEKELRTALGSFLFYGDDVFKKVSVLSPGEKARVSLCKIMLEKANFLILDEPTNHLDPETQKIIGSNFKDYEGTILLVSHNPAFVRQIGIDRMLLLPKGKITNYSDEVLEYYHSLQDKT